MDSHPDRTTNQADSIAAGDLSGEPLRYPTGHVVGVLDTEQQVADAVAALTGGGFLESGVQVATGTAAADRLNAGTGRVGLGNLAVSVAERLGIANDEMRLKDRHEEALRNGRFLILVATPTDDRKDRAAQLLTERGAHTLAYMGRFAIEGFVPPSPPRWEAPPAPTQMWLGSARNGLLGARGEAPHGDGERLGAGVTAHAGDDRLP